MEGLGKEWDDWPTHDDTYVVDGENVVVLTRYTATHKATGKAISVRVAHHFVIRGGHIARFEQFVDTALVSEAMTEDA
jgi:ketosteroid isomerase-like protein